MQITRTVDPYYYSEAFFVPFNLSKVSFREISIKMKSYKNRLEDWMKIKAFSEED